MKKISTKNRQLKNVIKTYTRFNLELYKKGIINKEEYLYNKNHISLNNDVESIKRLFSPLLENKSMKQFLWDANKDIEWTNERLWFKTNDYLLTISETSRNNSELVKKRINDYYKGDQFKFEQALERFQKENEKENH